MLDSPICNLNGKKKDVCSVYLLSLFTQVEIRRFKCIITSKDY